MSLRLLTSVPSKSKIISFIAALWKISIGYFGFPESVPIGKPSPRR
jgi:hypothetical protein